MKKEIIEKSFCLLLDWGDTVMKNYYDETGPMADWREVSLVEGFAETAQVLTRNYHLALASNGTDSDSPLIRRALQRVGADSFFSWIFCQREIGHAKPSPFFFSAVKSALKVYGALPVAMIGDDFERDVQGAVDAGIFGIWLNRSSWESRRGPHYLTIHSWPEIIPLLPGLELL